MYYTLIEKEDYIVLSHYRIWYKYYKTDHKLIRLNNIQVLKELGIKIPLTIDSCKYCLQLEYKCYMQTDFIPVVLHLSQNSSYPSIVFGKIKASTITQLKNASLNYSRHKVTLENFNKLIYKDPWYLKFLKKIVNHIKKLKNTLIR